MNGPKGLEQGFTLEHRPTAANGKPLTLAFAMSGNLAASVESGKRSLTLRKDKSTALRYSGLTALDANGHELPTWLEVSGKELRIRVDDAGARYPLTIDPYSAGHDIDDGHAVRIHPATATTVHGSIILATPSASAPTRARWSLECLTSLHPTQSREAPRTCS